jgi:hypothetical protein
MRGYPALPLFNVRQEAGRRAEPASARRLGVDWHCAGTRQMKRESGRPGRPSLLRAPASQGAVRGAPPLPRPRFDCDEYGISLVTLTAPLLAGRAHVPPPFLTCELNGRGATDADPFGSPGPARRPEICEVQTPSSQRARAKVPAGRASLLWAAKGATRWTYQPEGGPDVGWN